MTCWWYCLRTSSKLSSCCLSLLAARSFHFLRCDEPRTTHVSACFPMQSFGTVHTGQNPPSTLVKRLCSRVSAIYAASLGKQNLTKPSTQSQSKPVQKTLCNDSNIMVITLWKPAWVLAALLPIVNLEEEQEEAQHWLTVSFEHVLGCCQLWDRQAMHSDTQPLLSRESYRSHRWLGQVLHP
jgi:hypothetical protein